MGQPKPGPEAILICGILAGDHERLARARTELARHVGRIERASDVWPFHATDYYADEMGDPLWRQFVAFAGCVVPERLAAIKRATNEIELRLCEAYGRPPDRRPINLDPGYVSLGKLILATTKDHAHRVYLGDGVYAEVTLQYHRRRWQAWPWTYPDYAAGTYHPFLLAVRERLKAELRDRARTRVGNALRTEPG